MVSERATGKRYAGYRCDLDVHHSWRTDNEVIAYLPARWREFLTFPNGKFRSINPPSYHSPGPHGIFTRLDAFPASGPPGSDLDLMREQLLDPFNVARAVVSFNIGQQAALANTELANELVHAANLWSLDHWLSADDRIYGSLLVQTQMPDVAAREIRELGRHPKIAEVLLVVNGSARPFGHPAYHPIYEAAVEVGLPVALHIGGQIYLTGGMAHTAAGGSPSSRFERHTLQMQPEQHHLASFIVHGAFEKFPELKLVLKETGVGWIPWLLWELDAMRPILERESSWVRRDPSDYFRRHVRVTTQPLEEPDDNGDLFELLDTFGGFDDLLLFASDYPHHDTDDPDHIARRLPASWWDKVFHKNAEATYGWTPMEPKPSLTAAHAG